MKFYTIAAFDTELLNGYGEDYFIAPSALEAIDSYRRLFQARWPDTIDLVLLQYGVEPGLLEPEWHRCRIYRVVKDGAEYKTIDLGVLKG